MGEPEALLRSEDLARGRAATLRLLIEVSLGAAVYLAGALLVFRDAPAS